jgi:hypothetical protein
MGGKLERTQSLEEASPANAIACHKIVAVSTL